MLELDFLNAVHTSQEVSDVKLEAYYFLTDGEVSKNIRIVQSNEW